MNNSITVMHVITEQKSTYYNALSLSENLVSAIIYSYGNRNRILNDEYRNSVRSEAMIEMIQSVTGVMKAYSPSYDMISYTS